MASSSRSRTRSGVIFVIDIRRTRAERIVALDLELACRHIDAKQMSWRKLFDALKESAIGVIGQTANQKIADQIVFGDRTFDQRQEVAVSPSRMRIPWLY